jgi:tetratricopeptide (TPR) repeat protein
LQKSIRQHGIAFLALVAISATTLIGCVGGQQQIVGENVLSARQLSMEGADALSRGECDRACELLQKAAIGHPEDDRVQARLGEALWRKGERKQALQHLQRAVELSPDPQHLVRLGQMEFESGNLDTSYALAVQALETNRRMAEAWALMADVEKRRDQPAEALAHYQRSLAIRPHSLGVQLAMADLYRARQQHTRCLATLRLAAAQYSRREVPRDVMVETAKALTSLARHEEAVTTLREAARRFPADQEIAVELARLTPPDNTRRVAHLRPTP